MAVAGIGKALLSSVLRKSNFIKKKAFNLPYTEDYLRRVATRYPNRKVVQGERKGPGSYTKAVGKDYYNKFIEDFSKVYKTADQEGIGTLRASMGKPFWERARETAKAKKLITPKDTDRVYKQTGVFLGEQQKHLQKLYEPKRNLRQQKREAIQKVWDDIVKSSAKGKDGLPILSGKSEFYGKNIIPKLKEKFPKLFSDIKNDKLGRGKIYKLTEPTAVDKKMQYPPFTKTGANIDEITMYSQIPKYTDEKQLGKEARQYLVDLFRSRPSDLRTGDYKKDATKFLTFLRQQDFFDPKSKYFYKKHPEFSEYYLTRKQPLGEVKDFRRGLDLSHDQPTLIPGGEHKKFPDQRFLPWTGGEIGRTHYLPRDINRNIQTSLEMKAIDAIKNKNWKKLIELNNQMMSRNIRTTVSDPITGEEFPIGGWKEFGFSKGGKMPSYAAGGIGRLGAKLLQKLVGKLSKKELQMILDTQFKGTNPLLSPAKRRQNKILKKLGSDKYRWRNVKPEVFE